MKKILTLIIMLITLSACSALQANTPEPTATDVPQAGLPNPASVYCEENGNKLEIRTAADGSQSGVCVSPQGNTCDEWAYFRGECSLADQSYPAPATTIEPTLDASGGYIAPGTSEPISDWWGVIKSTESGAQYDDYFVRQDLGQNIDFGIASLDPTIEAQIEALRDSGTVVHLYGTLFSNVMDYNGSQIQVDRIELEK